MAVFIFTVTGWGDCEKNTIWVNVPNGIPIQLNGFPNVLLIF